MAHLIGEIAPDADLPHKKELFESRQHLLMVNTF